MDDEGERQWRGDFRGTEWPSNDVGTLSDMAKSGIAADAALMPISADVPAQAERNSA